MSECGYSIGEMAGTFASTTQLEPCLVVGTVDGNGSPERGYGLGVVASLDADESEQSPTEGAGRIGFCNN